MSVFTHIVLRPFQAEGREVQVGEPINASDWKNTERLVSVKYLRPMDSADYARLKATKKRAPKAAPVATKLKKFTITKKR